MRSNEEALYWNSLTSSLTAYFTEYTLVHLNEGESYSFVYEVISEQDQPYIVKLLPQGSADSLFRASLNYTWLKNKLAVPTVLFYENKEDHEILGLHKLAGETLERKLSTSDAKECIALYATALKQLHALAIDGQAYKQDLAEKIEGARKNMIAGQVQEEDFDEDHKIFTPQALFEEMLTLYPSSADLVFTHGDYCFDNLIIQQANQMAFIDIDRGGIADRYQDISIAIREIKSVFTEDMVSLFLKTYGLADLDQQKLKFYRMLDEFY